MDIAVPADPHTRTRRWLYWTASGVTVLVASFGLSRLRPAAPAVDRSTLWIDTVKRGPMLREVRGVGSLVPEDIRWISSTTDGRVERILVRPGTAVDPDTLILELSNPPLEQALRDAQLKVQAAEAGFTNLRIQLESDALQQQAAAASIEADYKKAAMQAEVNAQLNEQRLVSPLILKQSQLDADQLAARYRIVTAQLAHSPEAIRARLAVQRSEVDQARAVMLLKQRQVTELRVRAGAAGMLQVVAVEVGQQVAPGTNLARVADSSRLKAELKIAETQARELKIGQPVSVDTRIGVVNGSVARIDPSVQNGTVLVDVTIPGLLPQGVRPELSVDGTIELERLHNVLFVGRPALGREQSWVRLFRVDAAGGATRTQVKLGRTSVDTVEVLEGLKVGDQVILSDLSAWDTVDRLRLR